MTTPGFARDGDVLLHCSLERTVFVRRDAATGQLEVHKLLLRGSPDEAAREHAMARRAPGGVAPPLGADVDAATGRPVVRTRFCDGPSLDRLVADNGALSAKAACDALLPAARTLAAMHAIADQDAPLGICHGDVKPANLLVADGTTLLLDFEHAGPAKRSACLGTVGFAGPEAAIDAPLSHAFDVHCLGATLCWLVAAATPARARKVLALQDEPLRLLLEACLQRSPDARPSMSTVVEALEELAARLASDPTEAARDALLRGDLDACEHELERLVEGGNELRAALRSRRRLLRRVPWLAGALLHGMPSAPSSDHATLATGIERAVSALRRFPRATQLARSLRDGGEAALRLVGRALPSIAELGRKEQFGLARKQLALLDRVVTATLAQPSPTRPTGDGPAAMPTLFQKSPRLCLQRERESLEAMANDHDEMIATLEAAEANFALDEASAAVDRIGAAFGGASEAVARRRDRLHRFAFFLERIAQARDAIERLFPLAPNEDQRPLRTLVAECAAAVSLALDAGSTPGRSVGLRSLALSLDSLDEEFPAVRERVAPARQSLARMLSTTTDDGWRLVQQATDTLQKEPVPVRPLQMLLARLDALRAVEAIVDRPHRERSALLDSIESLRLRIEQAQAARDRLARGAEDALARGHWTTGLFDMERAAQHAAADEAVEDKQAEALRRRLNEARRRKQDLEDAQRRMHELQARCSALEDAASSTSEERQLALSELRDCLLFLAAHSQKDRRTLYESDLREVGLRIAEEQMMQCEVAIGGAADAPAALRVAERAMRELEAVPAGLDPDAEATGRLSRMMEAWQRRRSALAREVEAAHAVSSRRAVSKRLTVAATLLLFALTVAVSLLHDSRAAHASAHPLEIAALLQPEPLRQTALDLARALQQVESENGDRIARTEGIVCDRILACAELREFALEAFDVTAGRALAAASTEDRAAIGAAAAAARERIRQRIKPQ